MTEQICTFTEPVHEIELTLWKIDLFELKTSPFQRKESDNFVKKLSNSIGLGFFAPLLVVNDEGEWIVIDGQHRIAALLKAKGNFPVPCIELPKRFMLHALTYNVELADKIKDICTKGYYLYSYFVENYPESTEQKLSDYFFSSPYYVSLAFAYIQHGLSSPSLVETSVKKFDDWIDLTLPQCRDERERRGYLISSLENTVNNVGFSDYFLKQAIISKTNKALWGNKRKLNETFENGINQMIDHIESTDWSFLGG